MYDQNTNAVLLLCSYFSGPKGEDCKPLTPIEYGRLSKWLHEQGKTPAELMLDLDTVLSNWSDPKNKITPQRLRALFDRSVALALAVEKWQRAGIWVMTRSDPGYPKRLKNRLDYNSPALFYGVGEKKLLTAGGLCVVGSRGISPEDQAFTEAVGRQAALEGMNVVSGGAKGVDETAMLGALDVEGTAIGVLADSLLKAALSSKWRKFLMTKQLVLVSPFYPDARFVVGNAMARNKYIYCLSDIGLVVRSDEGSGGTWSGATENLKHDWVPLYVKADSDSPGNGALIEKGGVALELGLKSFDGSASEPLRTALGLAVSAPKETERHPDHSASPPEEVSVPKKTEQADENTPPDVGNKADRLEPPVEKSGPDLFYNVFMSMIKTRLDEDAEVNLADLNKDFPDIVQSQFIAWLDRAEKEGQLERQSKKRTYSLQTESPQLEMLGKEPE